MKNERMRTFKSQAENIAVKEATKFIIKWLFYITILLFALFIVAGKVSGFSTAEWLSDKILFVIFIIAFCILFILGYSYNYKESIYSKAYDKLLKDFSSSTVEIMFIPGTPLEILPIKAKDSTYQSLILKLPKFAKFYGILEKNNIIYIYVEFPNDSEKIVIDDVSKEDFLTYYKLVNDFE